MFSPVLCLENIKGLLQNFREGLEAEKLKLFARVAA